MAGGMSNLDPFHIANSCGSTTRSEAAARHRKQLYEMLCARADAGETSPSNNDIIELLDLNSPSSAARLLRDLESLGFIAVARGHQEREITLLKTGQVLGFCRRRITHVVTAPAVRLSGEEIQKRREQAERQRKAREAHFLDLEQTRYRLPQRGRALSEMVA